MFFTDAFIKRPVLASSLSILIVVVGLQSVFNLPIREYPEITNTVITITTNYQGASADLMQGFVTRPLEQAVAQASNIDYITSDSTLGSSVIKVQMKPNTSPNEALTDILAKTSSISSQLPKEVNGPNVKVSSDSATSVMYLGFTGQELNSSQITDYLQRVISPQMFTVPGISKINMYGGVQYALRVWLDPYKMAALGLTATDVTNSLASNNYRSTIGQSIGELVLHNGKAETQVHSVEELRKLVIIKNCDQVIYLDNIAKVSLEKSHDTFRAVANGKEAVVVAANAAPDANPVEVAAKIRDILPRITSSLPPNIKMQVLYDSTVAINESIQEVIKTIGEAVLIVLIVTTLFIGSIRAVIIPIIAIPLSLIGATLLMQFFGASWNLMTLLAMVLAIGLVVDDAIIVLENVDRHIKLGKHRSYAAIMGTREIVAPVIATTLTLVVVYSPIGLTEGVTGSLFKEFSLTLSSSILVSSLIALTLTPMMCSKILSGHDSRGKLGSGVDKVLNDITNVYQLVLSQFIDRRAVVLYFVIFVLFSLPILLRFIPSELAPVEDKGVVMLIANGKSNANLDYLQNTMHEVNQVLSNQPEVKMTQTFTGIPRPDQAIGIAVLTPWSQRETSQADITERVQSLVKEVPAMSVSAFQNPELPGTGSGLPIQMVITTPGNFDNLLILSQEILKKVRQNSGVVYSTLDLSFSSATMKVSVSKEKASAYGVSMQDIGNTLAVMTSDSHVNQVDLGGLAYEIIPQAERRHRLSPESLNHYYVRSKNGDMIPLGSLVSIDIISSPRSLSHFNQLNSATIGLVPAPGITMGEIINWLDDTANQVLPTEFRHDYMGASRQFISEGKTLYETFALALIIIFLVLAIQMNSWRDPVVIMVSVPLALCGSLSTLALGAATMNIYSQVGLITLVGLITKHGILICEVAKKQQLAYGLVPRAAVMEATKVRLRPILMTTAAMVSGLIPLLFATGAGAMQRFSIGIVMVSGLTIGTAFTLFILPVIYTYVAEKYETRPVLEES